MDRSTFDRYITTYNTGDLDALSSFYTDDVIFENFGDRHEGADVLVFMAQLDSVTKVTFDPIKVLIDGDEVAMEANGTIVAHQDLPDLPAGAMYKGTYLCRMFVFYTALGDQFSHIRVAGWQPIPA